MPNIYLVVQPNRQAFTITVDRNDPESCIDALGGCRSLEHGTLIFYSSKPLVMRIEHSPKHHDLDSFTMLLSNQLSKSDLASFAEGPNAAAVAYAFPTGDDDSEVFDPSEGMHLTGAEGASTCTCCGDRPAEVFDSPSEGHCVTCYRTDDRDQT